MLLKNKHLNQKPKKVFKKQNVLMSEDMLLKWFCDRRPSVTEAKLFTDGHLDAFSIRDPPRRITLALVVTTQTHYVTTSILETGKGMNPRFIGFTI
jgi:hypothetical protein